MNLSTSFSDLLLLYYFHSSTVYLSNLRITVTYMTLIKMVVSDALAHSSTLFPLYIQLCVSSSAEYFNFTSLQTPV